MSTRSGAVRSSIAVPSARNSGFDSTCQDMAQASAGGCSRCRGARRRRRRATQKQPQPIGRAAAGQSIRQPHEPLEVPRPLASVSSLRLLSRIHLNLQAEFLLLRITAEKREKKYPKNCSVGCRTAQCVNPQIAIFLLISWGFRSCLGGCKHSACGLNFVRLKNLGPDRARKQRGKEYPPEGIWNFEWRQWGAAAPCCYAPGARAPEGPTPKGPSKSGALKVGRRPSDLIFAKTEQKHLKKLSSKK